MPPVMSLFHVPRGLALVRPIRGTGVGIDRRETAMVRTVDLGELATEVDGRVRRLELGAAPSCRWR